MAIEWTFFEARLFIPAPFASGMRWWLLSGRRPARSKTEPRSTKKPSARWPANTVSPSGNCRTAAAESAG